ncbi:MAG: Ig-like domain-containing protein, partial [Clostridia bacterium]|nr:Ig-like domain-containing protein [Clostridia bacterium]
MDSIRKRLAALSMVLLTVAQVSLIAFADEEDYNYYDYDDTYYYDDYSDDYDEEYSYDNVFDYSENLQYSEDNYVFSDYESETISADGADSILGDVTGDGKITPTDSLLVLRYVCDLERFSELQKELADFDENGKVNSADGLLIHRKSLSIDENKKSSDTDKPIIPDTESEKDSETASSEKDTDENSNGYGDDAEEDYSIVVSGTKYTVPAGMTLYVTCDDYVDWGSTNTAIATVDDNGLILAKKPGKVNIIALEDDCKRTIEVTVTEAEPIRTVYASPNSAAKGDTVKLIATTDQTRTNVRFDVDINGRVQTVYAQDKTADDSHGIYTWTGCIKADTSGTFDVTAYAEKNGSWGSCDNGETTMFVSSSNSSTQVSLNTLRASDDVIRMISLYEGGLTEAEYDPIAYGDVMNYGYGVVIYAGDTFYNRASMSEYFADLVN